MDANLGGTAMYAALERIFTSRDGSIPSTIFLLTDGEVSLAFIIMFNSSFPF